MSISQPLKTLVLDSPLSLNEISRRSKVDCAQLSRWLRDKRHLGEDKLNSIADTMGVTISPAGPRVSER